MSNGNGCSTTLKALAAGLLALVLVVTLPLALVARNWAQVIFDPEGIGELVGGELVESGVLHKVAVEALLDSELGAMDPEDGLGSWLQFLEASEFERLTGMIFPPEWAKAQVEQVIRGGYAWIDDDRLDPGLAVDLRPIKSRLLSGGSAEVMDRVVDSWPSCTLEQVEEMTAFSRRTGELLILLCEPTEPLRSELIASTIEILNLQVRNSPDRLPLIDENPTERPIRDEIMAQKESLRLLRGLAMAGWLLPLALLGVVMSLVVRSYESLSKWWGWPLVGSGGMLFILMLITPEVAQNNFQQLIDSRGMPAQVFEALRSIWQVMLDSVMGRMAGQALLLLLAGGLLLLVTWWRKRSTST